MNLLLNSAIDRGRWDRCISRSLNGNVFGLSWFLDITCPDWEALTDDEYQSVMPVPVSKKVWRYKFIDQPPFTWQLGIFSNRIMDRAMVEEFLNSLPRTYRIRKMHLNKMNSPVTNRFRHTELEHAELDLIAPYVTIRKGFDSGLAAGMNEHEAGKLSVIKGLSANEFLQFCHHRDRSRNKRLRSSRLQTLRLVVSNSIRYRLGELYGAYTPENNLCAAAFIITFRRKASLIHTAADPDGIRNHAVPVIIDEFIKLHAEQRMILGVDDPSDRMNIGLLRQFGAKSCRFARITGRRNGPEPVA